jgi:hypothetical protein
MNGLLTFEDLCSVTGLTRPGDVVRCLQKQDIAVFYGKGGKPWTTIDLINKAGGLVRAEAANDEPYSPEIVCR